MQPIFIVIFTVIFLYFLNQENNTIEHYKNKKRHRRGSRRRSGGCGKWGCGKSKRRRKYRKKFRNLIKQRYHLDDYIAKNYYGPYYNNYDYLGDNIWSNKWYYDRHHRHHNYWKNKWFYNPWEWFFGPGFTAAKNMCEAE